MPGNSYGIIVEGGYDSAVYCSLVRKLASHEVRIFTRPCEGKPDLMKKFPGFLQAFKYQLLEQSIDVAIILVDSDGGDPTELEEKMRSRIASRQYPFEVHFHAVQHAMEAWLLADPGAITNAIRARSSRRLPRTPDAPETLQDPKAALRKLLTDAKVDYTSEVAAQIADNIDTQTLSARCPRFRIFTELVDC
jgi:Domain of unknown function (DUF4276)